VLTWALLPWLDLLAFCGIVLNMAKRQIRVFYGGEWAVMIAEIFEDGGEMIAASFLTATVAHMVLRSGAGDSRPSSAAAGPRE
jgi:hypothetical protein